MTFPHKNMSYEMVLIRTSKRDREQLIPILRSWKRWHMVAETCPENVKLLVGSGYPIVASL